jgi:UDP-glucose 4-epimerase
MGYIGSHAIIELVRHGGFEPVSIDSFINSTEDTADHIEAACGVRVPNCRVDLCDRQATLDLLRQHADAVGIIHFAALKSVPDSVKDPLLYYRNNLHSLENILEGCRLAGIKNIIFSSSCSIYGNVERLPVDEQTPFGKAESPYAHTKQIGEVMLQDYAKVWPEMRAIALRYFNPVGADHTGLNGENPINPPTALVPYITQTAAGIFKQLTVFGSDYNTRDGSCVRDYIHVTDLAEAHIRALGYLMEGRQDVPFDLFNLGSGEGITVLEAVRSFMDVTGVALPYAMGARRPGDVEAIYSNCEKMERLMGWRPTRGIDEMMRSAWKWQQHLMDRSTSVSA